MQFYVYYVFYSQFPHQRVSAAITAIFRVMILLQDKKLQMWLAASLSLQNN